MKRAVFTVICIMLFVSVIAQVPQGISHQAVIRNAANELVTDSPIGIRVSILQGTHDGTEVYSETHTPQSNANGLITFVIGQGNNQSSDLSVIDWSDGPYFIETEADPEGGTNYTIEGVSQLWSVPYALSAGTSGAGIAAGDSLVLKDEEGMTRFVLNPNTGMLKMMHNDTVWYSVEVGSPHVITHLNDDGSLTVSKGNGYEIYVFDEDNKNSSNIFYKEENTSTDNSSILKKEYYDPETGKLAWDETVESIPTWDENSQTFSTITIKKSSNYNSEGEKTTGSYTYDNGATGESFHERYNFWGDLEYKRRKSLDDSGNQIVEEEFHGDNEIIRRKKTYNKSGRLVAEEMSVDDNKQSETTYTSSIVPEMGLTTNTRIEKLFNAQEELVQETTQTSQIKATSLENYLLESNEIKRFLAGELSGTSKETDRHFFNTDGSVTRTINKITQAADIYSVFQQVENNGIPTVTKRFEKNPDLPGTGATLRQQTSHAFTDRTSETVTEYNTETGLFSLKESKTVNLDNNSVTTMVEKPDQGSTSITQTNTGIEFNASQVVTEGNHFVTGEFGVVGDFGAFVSNDLNVFGNSNVEGDQEVGGNLSTLLDMIAQGKKKFRIDHPQFPDTKFLQHASIESNEVLNLYSGNVETDNDGNATVTLPDYFDLINTDFRYQLTVIGTTFARAIIFSEIDSNNQFVIKTDEPNTKVSWQVTAKRNDQYLIDNPFSDVVDK